MAAFVVLWHLGLLPFILMFTWVGIICLILQVLLHQMAALLLYNLILVFLYCNTYFACFASQISIFC